MHKTTLTIPSELMKWFRDYCKKQHRSVSAQITFMIENLKITEESPCSGNSVKNGEQLRDGQREK